MSAVISDRRAHDSCTDHFAVAEIGHVVALSSRSCVGIAQVPSSTGLRLTSIGPRCESPSTSEERPLTRMRVAVDRRESLPAASVPFRSPPTLLACSGRFAAWRASPVGNPEGTVSAHRATAARSCRWCEAARRAFGPAKSALRIVRFEHHPGGDDREDH